MFLGTACVCNNCACHSLYVSSLCDVNGCGITVSTPVYTFELY